MKKYNLNYKTKSQGKKDKITAKPRASSALSQKPKCNSCLKQTGKVEILDCGHEICSECEKNCEKCSRYFCILCFNMQNSICKNCFLTKPINSYIPNFPYDKTPKHTINHSCPPGLPFETFSEFKKPTKDPRKSAQLFIKNHIKSNPNPLILFSSHSEPDSPTSLFRNPQNESQHFPNEISIFTSYFTEKALHNNIITQGKCEHCQKTSNKLLPRFCSHKICNDCTWEIKDFKEGLCSMCKNKKIVKFKQCGCLFCRECEPFQCQTCFYNETPENCEKCWKKSQGKWLECNHFICFECLRNGIGCDECMKEPCMRCKKYSREIKETKTECRVCDKCMELSFVKEFKGLGVCKNCGEHNRVKKVFHCQHKGCEMCVETNPMCFVCLFEKKILASYAVHYQECFKCRRSVSKFQLFCGHSICYDCISYKMLDVLDFCCLFCSIHKGKTCLKCKKRTEWKFLPSENTLHKKCCNTHYCANCFSKKRTFLGKLFQCNCTSLSKNN